jgi:hypothetical protein
MALTWRTRFCGRSSRPHPSALRMDGPPGRFLMHVLPRGFHKLRYYGLWHPSKRDLQQRARLLLTVLAREQPGQPVLIADLAEEADPSGDGGSDEGFSPSCPYCGSRQVDHLQERHRGLDP